MGAKKKRKKEKPQKYNEFQLQNLIKNEIRRKPPRGGIQTLPYKCIKIFHSALTNLFATVL